MKNKILLLFLFTNIFAFSQVGIGTTNPDNSSSLDITSTDSGFLMPRMTMIERDSIVAPATGLLIFQTDNTPGFYYYNGNIWKTFGIVNPTTIIFPKLPIPALAGANTGAASDYIFTITVNGITYTITRRTQDKNDGGPDVSQRLKLEYTFTPALPFIPTAKTLTPNQENNAINDGFTISCKKLTISENQF